MNAVIKYEELAELVRKKYKSTVRFEYIDVKTIKVIYKHRFLPLEICLQISIDAIQKDMIAVSYHCHSMVAHIIKRKLSPYGIVINKSNKQIVIYPARVEALKKLYQFAMIRDIIFDNNAVDIRFEMI